MESRSHELLATFAAVEQVRASASDSLLLMMSALLEGVLQPLGTSRLYMTKVCDEADPDKSVFFSTPGMGFLLRTVPPAAVTRS